MARKGDGIFKRGKVWRLDCIIAGKRHQGQLGRGISRAVALDLATAYRAAILRGEAGILQKKKDVTFEKASADFLEAMKGRIRENTYRSYETCLNSMADHFKGKSLSEISAFLIEAWKKKRKEDAPVSFNRELGTLRTMFNWCIDNGRFDGGNPTRKVKRLTESRGHQRALEPEEEVRLLEACREPLKTILLCGIDAGLRIPSETLWLKKTDIDWSRNTVTVPAAFAKNGKAESVPLTPRLREALRRVSQSNPKSEYIFTRDNGQPFKSIQNIFRTAAAKAEITGIYPHVMRHTFATRLDKSGASLREIQELGRWADIRMVQRYSNVSERNKREAIQRLSDNSPKVIPSSEINKEKSYQGPIAVNDRKA
jgi:integrase